MSTVGQLITKIESSKNTINSEVNSLKGSTGNQKLEVLANAVSEVRAEVDTQTNLINQIQTALQNKVIGVDTSDATAVAEDIALDKTAYVKGNKVTGTFTIDNEMSEQDTLITQIQTALQNKASVSPTLQQKSVTPSASEQVVTADIGYDGLKKVTVAGDSNLVAENIAEGVSIFGVEGTHSGGAGGVDTCTVVVNVVTGRTDWAYAYTAYENSSIVGKANSDWYDGVGTSSLTFNNVVCGSIITVVHSSATIPYCSVSDDTMQFIAGMSGDLCFTAPTTAGVTATATLSGYVD